jgi:hypothetical protein
VKRGVSTKEEGWLFIASKGVSILDYTMLCKLWDITELLLEKFDPTPEAVLRIFRSSDIIMLQRFFRKFLGAGRVPTCACTSKCCCSGKLRMKKKLYCSLVREEKWRFGARTESK